MAIASLLVVAVAAAIVNIASSQQAPGPVPAPAFNIWDSSFFKCGARVYANDGLTDGILFPPSDFSMPNVTNMTLAVQAFWGTYRTFCGKLNSFTSCVYDQLRTNETNVDRQLKVYINTDNFGAAMGAYCNNQDNIPNQLQCTMQAVQRYSCPIGGVLGILDYITYVIEARVPKTRYCSELRGSIQCRVTNQLTPCGASYAQTMANIYNGLTALYCSTP